MIRSLCGLSRTALACGVLLHMVGPVMALAQGTVPEPLPGSNEAPVSIRVDLNEKVGSFKPIYSWFGYDEAQPTPSLSSAWLKRKDVPGKIWPQLLKCRDILMQHECSAGA